MGSLEQVENASEKYLKRVGRTGEGYTELYGNERAEQLLIIGKIVLYI